MNNRRIFFFIWLVTVIIIGLIGLAYFLEPMEIKHQKRSFIPPLNATLNALALVNLITAYYHIKIKHDRKKHQRHIIIALGFTTLFLIFYLIYHFTTPPTRFMGSGVIKYFYYFILFTHVILAAINLPLVLITLQFAIRNELVWHRKFAKIAFPVWAYVSLTGILVFLFNLPYY